MIILGEYGRLTLEKNWLLGYSAHEARTERSIKTTMKIQYGTNFGEASLSFHVP